MSRGDNRYGQYGQTGLRRPGQGAVGLLVDMYIRRSSTHQVIHDLMSQAVDPFHGTAANQLLPPETTPES